MELSLSDSQVVQHEEDGLIERASRVVLFGFEPTDATARLYYRDPFWRGSRALMFGGLGLVLSPIAFLVPPHGVWAMGVLTFGGIMAYRKWSERRTLIFLEAVCPRCESPLRCSRATRMRRLHSITCESCHNEMELQIIEE